jgi:hypothetical protein
MTAYCTIPVNQPMNALASALPGPPPAVPSSAPAVAGYEYFVYRSGPDSEHPAPYWAYFPATMPVNELPDIRYFQPVYIWSANTKKYTAIKSLYLKF